MSIPSNVAPAVASDQFAADWRAALHGNGNPLDSWEHIRTLAGGLYDTLQGVVKTLRPPEAISLACGDGTVETKLAAMGVHKIHARDINPQLLRLAQDNFRARFPLPRFNNMQFLTDQLDIGTDFSLGRQARLVLCQSAAMFMDESQIDGLLSSARRCVDAGGRFWFSFTAFDQGVGTYRRKRDRLMLIDNSAEPDSGDPKPFAYKRRDGEGQNAPEYFRPRWWWDRKVAEHCWKIDEFWALSIPLDAEGLRTDKFFPGMRTYDVYLLA